MKDSKEKLKEILAVINILLLITDKDTTITHQEYISKIKNVYDLNIDRRRVSQIINDLYEIQNENPLFLPFFEIKECKKGKGKFYADKGDLKDVSYIIKGIKSSTELTEEKIREITELIYRFFTDKEKEEIKKWL